MTSILTDSMAREHATSMQAAAAASRRARSAREASRAGRRSDRRYARPSDHPRTSAVSHAAARPFAAMRNWLVAGEL